MTSTLQSYIAGRWIGSKASQPLRSAVNGRPVASTHAEAIDFAGRMFEDETLQGRRAQDQPLQRAEVDALQPTDHWRIAARLRRACPLTAQLAPMHSGMSVMFEVITVIEEDKIVEPAIMTDRPARVLVVPLQSAEPEPAEIAR